MAEQKFTGIPEETTPIEVVKGVGRWLKSKLPKEKTLEELALNSVATAEKRRERAARTEQAAKNVTNLAVDYVLVPGLGILKGTAKSLIGAKTLIEKGLQEVSGESQPQTAAPQPQAPVTAEGSDTNGGSPNPEEEATQILS